MLTLLAATLSLLSGCSDPKPSDSGASDEPTDADGDGVLTPEDCDDGDEAVYPGAADLHGDGIDGDCDGLDGAPFAGCSPILVPDLYATIEDALVAGETNLCLGAGSFTPGPLPEGARGATALRGQGRDLTFVTDPAAHYAVGVLAGLTASGAVAASGSLSCNDVTFVDAVVAGFDNFLCDRCALVRSPVEVTVVERIAGIVMSDSWVSGAEEGIRVVTDGCANAGSCSGYFVDVRISNTTFSGNTRSFAMDLSGNYAIYLVIQNSIFLNDETLLAVDEGGVGAEASVYTSGSNTLMWGAGPDPFPDGYSIRAREQDPELDLSFSPPRPMDGSPAIDSAGDGATLVDFWGAPRDVADKGAVER